MNLLTFDLAPRKCGWCAGDGSRVPEAGGFRLSTPMVDLGALLEEMRGPVVILLDRHRPGVVLFESPILPSTGGAQVMGTLEQRRAQFAQGAFLEWLCLTRGITCVEVGVYDVKMALTGSKRAEKDDMVRAAEKLGVQLPATKVEGREDAADATGVWLHGIRLYAKQFAPEWDRRVYSPRGGLL